MFRLRSKVHGVFYTLFVINFTHSNINIELSGIDPLIKHRLELWNCREVPRLHLVRIEITEMTRETALGR
jgi:hypothetical protein